MARDPDEERREALIRFIGRPLLLVLWSLVLWGSLYALVLIYGAATEGPRATLQRAMTGRDVLAGAANLGLAATAALVWVGVGVAAWLKASRRRAKRPGDHSRRNQRLGTGGERRLL